MENNFEKLLSEKKNKKKDMHDWAIEFVKNLDGFDYDNRISVARTMLKAFKRDYCGK